MHRSLLIQSFLRSSQILSVSDCVPARDRALCSLCTFLFVCQTIWLSVIITNLEKHNYGLWQPFRGLKNMFCLFSLQKGQSYLPIMPFSQSKLSEDSLNNRSSLKNWKRVIESRTEEAFVISERETDTGCAQRELMEEQEILYNKGIFIKL